MTKNRKVNQLIFALTKIILVSFKNFKAEYIMLFIKMLKIYILY